MRYAALVFVFCAAFAGCETAPKSPAPRVIAAGPPAAPPAPAPRTGCCCRSAAERSAPNGADQSVSRPGTPPDRASTRP